MQAYHVTPTRNIPDIQRAGLIPTIGVRSAQLGEKVPAVYLFPTLEDVEDGLYGWLGDELEDEENVSLIKVDISDLATESEVEWEIKVLEPISPDRILSIGDVDEL